MSDKKPLALQVATDPEAELPPLHVIVRFGKLIPVDEQGPVMLQMEKALRAVGIPDQVFKSTLGDDNKWRATMTADERKKL